MKSSILIILAIFITTKNNAQVNEFEIPTIMSSDNTILQMVNTNNSGGIHRLLQINNPNPGQNQDMIEMNLDSSVMSQFMEFQVLPNGIVGKINSDGSASFKSLGIGDNILSSSPTDLITIESTGNNGMSIIGDDSGETYIKLINNKEHKIFNDFNSDDLVLEADAGENINFKDGNTINMAIKGNGDVGIGTNNPITKLQTTVAGTDGILVLGTSTGDPFFRLQNSGAQHTFYSDFSKNNDLTIESGINKNIVLKTGNTDRIFIDAISGNIGIGDISPSDALDIDVNGFDGISVNGDGTSDPFFKITNSGLEHFIYSDNDESNRFVMQSHIGRDLAFNTGLSTRMHIESSTGHIGMGTETPEMALHIAHDNTVNDALMIENNGTNEKWQIRVHSNDDLQIWNDLNLRGTFNHVTGAYTFVSDKRLKKDITQMKSTIGKINMLKPSQYKIRSDASNKICFGLIAQEVKEIFPEVVSIQKNSGPIDDLHTISYTELIPILIKGMQEQQAQIEAQQKLIDNLLKE